MRYVEIPPPAGLSPWVRCAWLFEAPAPGDAPERIVPDGRPELIVHAGAVFAELPASGPPRPQPRALFAGQLTVPLHLRGTGPALVVGVRFHPHGARAFFGRSMREANDRRIGLDAIVPGSVQALALAVREAVSDEARIGAVIASVRDRITQLPVEVDEVVRACVEALEREPDLGIEALVDRAGIGRRQLERRFADAVGIGPALLASILRFRRAFDVLERDGARPWTEAALAAGYYDQSHFIREFRRFVGCRPSEFFRPRVGLAEVLVLPGA
jgi:AraC-like DNA-binding protein